MIIGCIYKHPNMDIREFCHTFLSQLLDKISLENKKVMLLGDFNINLLNCDSDKQTLDFLEEMVANSLLPKITSPTRITPRSKTLIDNIFYNEMSDGSLSGNLLTTISDHLTQFLVLPHEYLNNGKSEKPKQQQKHNFRKLNRNDFQTELEMIDWDSLLVPQDVNSALDTFLDKINILLDKHAPVEPVSNRYLKQHRKPWVDKDLLKLFKERDKMYKRFQKEKDDTVKKVLFDNFKVKRNEVIKLSRHKKR